jgi:hypothetical protein
MRLITAKRAETHVWGRRPGVIDSLLVVTGWLIFLLIPFFRGHFTPTADEQVLNFSAAYDLTLFYPGSNRMASFLPLLGSLAPTMAAAAALQLTTIALMLASGVYFFLGGSMGMRLATILLLSLAAWVFGLPKYSFYLSNAEPYVAPFGLVLLALASRRMPWQGAITAARLALQFLLLLVAAGLNPSSGAFAVSFECVILVEALLAWPCQTGSLAANLARASAAQWPKLAIACAAVVAPLFWMLVMRHTLDHFPSSTASNFSNGNYAGLDLSWQNLVQSYSLTVDFLTSKIELAAIDRPWDKVLLPSDVARWLVHALLLLPLPLGLAAYRVAASREQRQWAVDAIALFGAALATGIAISGSAHVLTVTNSVRGRYFQICVLGVLLSGAMSIVAVSAQAAGRTLPKLSPRLLALYFAGICATLFLREVAPVWLGHGPAWSAEELQQRLVANEIRSSGAAALVGDYWIVWKLQALINDDPVTRGPRLMPLSYRSEAFSVRGYRPLLDHLEGQDGFILACIRPLPLGNGKSDRLPPGDCSDKTAFMVDRNAFPRGHLSYRDGKDIGVYRVDYYQFSRTERTGDQECSSEDVLFRAVAGAGSSIYGLYDGGFILAGSPSAGNAVKVTLGKQQPTELTLLPHQEIWAKVGKRSFQIWRNLCRLMVISDSPTLFGKNATAIVIDWAGAH